jgi:O-antigen/teichoic acid export membrane protein
MNRGALSDTAFSSFAVYIEYLFGLIASVLIARALLPADMGVYSLLIWVVANAVAIANAGITMGAIKFIAELRGADRDDTVVLLVKRLRRMQRIMLALVVAMLALAFLLADRWLPSGVERWLLGALLLSVALRAPYMFNVAVLKGHQDFRSTAIVAAIGASLNLGMIVLVWSGATSLPGTLPTFVAIFAVSSVVFLAVSQWRASRFLRRTDVIDARLPDALEARVRHHLRVAGFTTVLGVVGSSEIELLALNWFSDAADAGLFKVASALAAGVALLVPGVLSAQLLPMMAKARGRSDEEAAQRFVAMTVWLFVLGAPLVAAGAVFSDHAILLLYGKPYAEAAPVLALLLIARVASVLGQGATAYLLSADRQTALMRLTVLFTVLRVIAIFASAWAYGLAGAVVATVVLALCGSGATIRLAMRVSATALPWARLLRISVAAALPAACCLTFADRLAPLPGLLIGTVVFAIGYPLSIWLMRGLDEADAEAVRRLTTKLRRRVGS